MKKILGLFVLAFAAIILAGCDQQKSDSGTTTPPADTNAPATNAPAQ